MQIRVYNPVTLKVIHVFGKATSIQWTRKFSDVGNFEIHFPVNVPGAEYLQIGNFIEHDGKGGIIGFREQTRNDITVTGYDLNGISKMRCTVPPFVYKENPETMDGYDRIKGTAEDVLRYYVQTHMIEPTDTHRKIENVRLGAYMGFDLDKQIAWQSRFETLDIVLNDICTYTKLGYRFLFVPQDNAIWFDVLKGTDRTVSQNAVAPVIFCRKYKTISDYTYTDDKLNFKNVVYVGGSGEEEQQYITEMHSETEVLEPSGVYRYEGFAEISTEDVEEVDNKGFAYLKENACEDVIEAVAGTRLKYKKDWNLGDFVTVKTKAFGQTMFSDKQITEVKEIFEPGHISVEPVFGEKSKEV